LAQYFIFLHFSCDRQALRKEGRNASILKRFSKVAIKKIVLAYKIRSFCWHKQRNNSLAKGLQVFTFTLYLCVFPLMEELG